MSSGLDIEFVRATYQRMTDDEVVRILTQEAAGLTPEAIEMVKEEVKRRNLDPNILNGITAQRKSYTVEEIDKYCDLIQLLPCPINGSTAFPLNATVTYEAKSYIFMTHYSKKILIGSPDALDKANKDALIRSVLLGWWGFPWGIIRTVQAIVGNLNNRKTNHTDTPNDFLRSFVLSRIGEIETYKNDKEKLLAIITINNRG